MERFTESPPPADHIFSAMKDALRPLVVALKSFEAGSECDSYFSSVLTGPDVGGLTNEGRYLVGDIEATAWRNMAALEAINEAIDTASYLGPLLPKELFFLTEDLRVWAAAIRGAYHGGCDPIPDASLVLCRVYEQIRDRYTEVLARRSEEVREGGLDENGHGIVVEEVARV